MSVARQIGEPDLDRYSAMLDLSDAQRRYLEYLYEIYQRDWDEGRQKLMPRLADVSAAYADRVNQSQYDPETLEFCIEFHALEAEVKKQDWELEKRLLDGLEAVLGPSQLSLMPRVRMHRQRAGCPLNSARVPGAKIDLSREIEHMALQPDQLLAVDSELQRYENELTPLLVVLEQKEVDRNTPLTRLLAASRYDEQGQPLEAGSEQSTRRLRFGQQRRLEILAECAELEKQVADLNRTYLPRLCKLLDADSARTLQDSYYSFAYWAVYENRRGLERLYASIVDSATKTKNEGLVDAVQQIWKSYEKSYDKLSTAMSDRFDAWNEQKAATTASTNYEEYAADMRKMRDERSLKSKAVLSALKDVLPADLLQFHQAEIERLLVEIENDRIKGQSDGYPYS